MATSKLYTVAGVSKLNGEYKVRFANDVMRIKVLAKHGHEDITLVELPTASTKLEAVNFIRALDEFAGTAEQAAIADYLDRNGEKPAKAVAAPVAKAKAKAPAKAPKAPKAAATADLEDAPF
jgi:hypothetical protein